MSEPTGPRFYGRRKGHDLTKARQQLVTELLPQLRLDPTQAGDPKSLFGKPVREVWLEIGFGAGEHLAHQAAQHPDIGFIGAEPYMNGVAALVAEVAARGVANLRIHDDDAARLIRAFPSASIARLFILFPDPWPKARHHKRRFVGPANLDEIARILEPGAELRFATDHAGYLRWALFYLLRDGRFAWTAKGPEDWRQRWPDAVETRYEVKGLAGTPSYLTFLRR